jgi:outer membrane protein TolC
MDRHKVFATMVVTALLLSGRGTASEEMSPALVLDEAIAMALAQHPRVERSRFESQAAEEGVRAARSNYYPWVAVEGIAKDGLSGAAGGLGLVGLPGSPFFDKLAIAVNVSFNALDFGRTSNAVDAARFTAASLRSREEAEKAAVVWQVRTAYYRCLQAEELLRVARDTLEERKLTARQARIYYEAELRSKLDASLSEVRVKEAEAELIRAENQRQLSFATLNLAMGVPGGGAYRLAPTSADSEPGESLEGLVERSLLSRPDLEAAHLEAQAVQASLDAARSERLPQIRAVASFGKARFAEGVDGKDWLVGVGVSVPVFTGFSVDSRIHQAEARLRAARARRKEIVQRVRFEVQRAYLDLGTARSLEQAARAQASLAEESLRLATQRYGAQLGSFLDLTAAELSLVRSKQARAQAVYDVMIARATLDFVVGAALPGSTRTKAVVARAR